MTNGSAVLFLGLMPETMNQLIHILHADAGSAVHRKLDVALDMAIADVSDADGAVDEPPRRVGAEKLDSLDPHWHHQPVVLRRRHEPIGK